MRNRIGLAALAGGVVVALALPVAAQASSTTVYMGPPPKVIKNLKPPAALQNLADINAYFPNKATIHVGDSLKFINTSFHTVNIPAKGKLAPFLFAPDGKTISGQNDAAGQPFWFNGQPELNFTPSLFPPQFGKTVTYNGKGEVQSGLPIADKTPPFTIKFTKTGTFTFFCNVHPGMKGKVHVVAKTAKAPTAKGVATAIVNQAKKGLGVAKRLLNTHAPGGTVEVGPSGPGGVELFEFSPGNLSVKVGQTVTFANSDVSVDQHTVTFGPGDPEKEPTSYLGQLSGSLQSPHIAQAAVFPSERPGTVASYTSSLHGNGFWNAGILDSSPATPSLPRTNSVTFTQAGTFNYFCLIHPFMHGAITVTS